MTAAGEATVAVPGLGKKQALVLDDAPRLLSVGLLVQDGYTLRWGPSGCSLSRPGEAPTQLQIVDGIPVLPREAGSAGCGAEIRATQGTPGCGKAETRQGRRVEGTGETPG